MFFLLYWRCVKLISLLPWRNESVYSSQNLERQYMTSTAMLTLEKMTWCIETLQSHDIFLLNCFSHKFQYFCHQIPNNCFTLKLPLTSNQFAINWAAVGYKRALILLSESEARHFEGIACFQAFIHCTGVPSLNL